MSNNKIEKISKGNEIIALIVPADFDKDGIEFFTPDSFPQQVGYMSHPKGHKIMPHVHRIVPRLIDYTQEVLIIREGSIEVCLYSKEKDFICKRILNSGDIILLASGGHSFKMLKDTTMVEIKQGPYIGDKDKERFKREINDSSK